MLKQLALASLLHKKDHPPLSQAEQNKLKSGLKSVVESLWLTEHVMHFKPAVMDEVRYGIYHFDNVVFDAVIDVHERLLADLPASAADKSVNFITFGSWIGGDRDGNPFRISEVRFMEFKVKAKETISTLVQVQSDTRIGSLSRDMLKFIDEKGYTIGENGEYRVKMEGWDFNKPLIELPMKHFDTVDYMHSIESFIKGTAAKNAKTLTSFTTPAAALAALS